MLNVIYWRIFCDVISLLAQVFIVSLDRAYILYQEVHNKKNIEHFSIVKFFVIWLYLQKAMYRPCDLDLWPMNVKFVGELITTLFVSRMNFRSISVLIAEK